VSTRASAALLVLGGAGAIAAALAEPGDAANAASQAWPAFVLVAGLLLIGAVAAREGVFAAAGTLAARVPGGTIPLLVVLLLLEAVVTAVLNLDTAVVFMTPVLLQAARRRGIPDGPFLYGAVFMANSASILLPGSNLTNLIVLRHEQITGSTFAARLAPSWCVAVAVTVAFVLVAFRRELRGRESGEPDHVALRPRAGAAAIVVAAVLVLVLANPALPVLGVGILAVLVSRLPAGRGLEALNPALLLGVLGVAVALGTLARHVAWFASLVDDAGRWETAGIAAAAALLVNNLPAAVVLSAHIPAHPRALLLGLDLGPNLAVTGSLSAVLWLQVARASGARPSIVRYTLLGLVLVPVSLALTLLTPAPL
jgi:arsenical pump membrane protein